MREFLNKNKLMLVLALSMIVGIPLIVNFIISISQNIIPIGINNDWIGFFGSYSGSLMGGIIGALIAIYVAKVQVKQQKDNFEKDLKFRLEQQEKSIQSQQKLWEQQQIDEALKIKKEVYKKQIYYLRQFEMEIIKIRQTYIKLAKQAKESVFTSNGVRYDAISKERNTNSALWSNIDKLVDDEIKLRLHLLQEQYDEMIDTIGSNVWELEDEIDLLKIEIEKYRSKKKRNKADEIQCKMKLIKEEELKEDLKYIQSEKIYQWDIVYQGKYIQQAESLREIIRKELIKSCELNKIEIPLDPNTV